MTFDIRPTRFLLISFVAIVGLLVPMVATPPAAIAAKYKADSQECKMLKLINDFRRRNGEDPLQLSATLGAAAEDHSQAMARRGGNLYHSSASNFRSNGYKGSPIGENVAGGTNWASPQPVFDGWEKSSGHRRNMLEGQFNVIGIAREYSAGTKYGWYWTTTFGGDPDAVVRC